MQDCLKSSGIKILDWPSNSSDFNLIENVWHIIDSKISEKKKKVSCYGLNTGKHLQGLES